jgi:voltage-gated potassium channel
MDDRKASHMPEASPQAQPASGGRAFEWAMQLLVLYSIVCYYLETESGVSAQTGVNGLLWPWNERIIGILFTLEYLYRWWTAKDRLRHPVTLMALIDAAAVLPFYLGLIVDLRTLKLIRTLRVLRVFKLYRYNTALQNVLHGFRKVKHELAVVGLVVVIVVVVSSEAMYEFEHDVQPDKFGRLSDSVWWSFVTLTTVGYGDMYPITAGGRVIATITMVLGIGIFGTFISLIGSSFLSTMREEALHHHHHHHHHLTVMKTDHAAAAATETVPWLDTVNVAEKSHVKRASSPHW